jgi:hypothetical protein
VRVALSAPTLVITEGALVDGKCKHRSQIDDLDSIRIPQNGTQRF